MSELTRSKTPTDVVTLPRLKLRELMKGLAPDEFERRLDEVMEKVKPEILEELPPGMELRDMLPAVRAEVKKMMNRMFEVILEDLGPYLDQLEESLRRVTELVTASEVLTPGPRQDALRAAVVLTHAYLEDFLRTLAAAMLPNAREQGLDGIPLAGLTGRPEKFSLGKLVQHRGKTVDDLLRQSVSEYLERSNFNNTTEISALLIRLGFEPAEHHQTFPAIQEMIERRHQIVHRQDKRKASEPDNYVLVPIESAEVGGWSGSVANFVISVMTALVLKLDPAEFASRIFQSEIQGQ